MLLRVAARTRVAAIAGLAGCLLASGARAQEADPFVTRGPGIAGGALLAAELTVTTEALLGVRSGWILLLSGVAAAGLGGYAGYLVEENSTERAGQYLLAGGMAGILPSMVWVGDALRVRPGPVQPDADDVVTLSPPSAGVARDRTSGEWVPFVRVVSGAF